MRAGEPLILWDWTFNHLGDIGQRILEHLELTGIAVGIGFVLAALLTIGIRQLPVLYGPVTWITGVLYTIPSLALFALLVTVTGLSLLTAEIGLVTVTALIGQGGLGFLIRMGIDQFFSTPLLIGAVLSIALAVLCDAGLVVVQHQATPWTRRAA